MSSDSAFHVVGVSHHTASVGVREQFAFTPDQLAALLAHEHDAGRAALILSTCNRCELYWTGDFDYQSWFGEFARVRGVAHDAALSRLDGAEAIRHLFTVAAGLDSQILGETEILGQVRRAYDAARSAGTTSREMDLIFSSALAAGRRVRNETMLGRHPASVSSAAVDVAASELGGRLSEARVLVLGAGEAAEGVLRSLHDHHVSRMTLVNRKLDRAATLASAWGATPSCWDALPSLLDGADLIMVATGASRPVLSSEQLASVVARRSGQPVVVMDLGVPRNVEIGARRLPGVRLFDLDDLQRLCCPAAATPTEALRDAERMLQEEMGRLAVALRGRAAAPRLAELHRLGAQVAEQETAWALSQLDDLTDRERGVVREMADRLVRRVLYPVSRSLRQD